MANPNPLPATRFRPGHSGNPDGSTAKVRHRILRDIRAEFEPMTALERVAYAQIEALLKTAARAGDPLARIRTHNSVSRLLARFALAACSRVGRCGPVAS
jgi:hypothetical protein